MNWQLLSASSHYQTAKAVQEVLHIGNIHEADKGITELIEALSRSEKRALKSQIIRLMKHIIKWKTQPEKRSRSWIAAIHQAKNEIRDIQEETPSLTNDVIRQMWDNCLNSAIIEAEDEMNQDADISHLTWEEVFDKEYRL